MNQEQLLVIKRTVGSIALILIILALTMLFQSYSKYTLQMNMYQRALDVSKAKGKPLLVIGNPKESSTNKWFGTYGLGDICIDMNKCESDEVNSKSFVVIGKLEDELHKFSDNSVVIFESETLEYIDKDKIDDVIKEMYRISNKDIFSVHQLKAESCLTGLKQFGYETYNSMSDTPVFTYKRLMTSYPPNDMYAYVNV